MPDVENKPKKVAPRNELKTTALSKEPFGINKKDPRFAYQLFSTDPNHPSYIGHHLRPREIGDGEVGYALVDPWEVVTRDNDPALEVIGQRDDQGKPIDRTWRQGDLILCRTPKENAAKYDLVHNARVEANGRELYQGSKQRFGAHTTKAIVADGETMVNEALEGV